MHNHAKATYALAAALLAATPAMAGSSLPTIKKVVLTAQKGGTYKATIHGVNFGAAPFTLPCTQCTALQLQVVNQATQPSPEAVNITAWTNRSIVVTGIKAATGDSLRIAVFNATIGNAGAWGGFVGANTSAPTITSVHTSGSGQNLTLLIQGAGFGTAPSAVGQTTVSPYLVVTDFNATQPYSDGFPWNAGFCGANNCDGVTATYVSWTDTQIVIGGFGGLYGNEYQANPNDAMCVGVWSGNSTSNGTTGGANTCFRLPAQ